MTLELSRDPTLADQQLRALTFCLVAFGYIDGELDPTERAFIRNHLTAIARTRAGTVLGVEPHAPSSLPVDAVADEFAAQYLTLFDQYDAIVRGHLSESVGEGESSSQFVAHKLKLGCFELLSHLDETLQLAIVKAVGELMHADGRVHANEAAFFEEVTALTRLPIELEDTVLTELETSEGAIVINAAQTLAPRMANHPFFRSGEWDFSRDPQTFAEQCQTELELCAKVEQAFVGLRTTGAGKLTGLTAPSDLPSGPRVLDGRVYLQKLDRDKHYELLVLGDIHGCYSCLKAAILQANFFEKLRAHEADPSNTPEIALVLLGDYIDRGRFGYTGTLRTAMRLLSHMPNEVVMLRGNHEYYVEVGGRVVAPVRPCEAMDSLATVDGARLLNAYRKMFDDLPTTFLFGDVMFVHGGIPRDETLERKWQGLGSLNDPEIAFEMLWSDPSDVDAVPRELQREVARFGFGRRQFQHFMKLCGCRAMVRGHERVCAGFKTTYDDAEATLVTLFSAGGTSNAELPATSNYREVTPMALTVTHRGGVTNLTPFAIDYGRYNDAKLNGFFKEAMASVGGA
jgi:hypothetical protein